MCDQAGLARRVVEFVPEPVEEGRLSDASLAEHDCACPGRVGHGLDGPLKFCRTADKEIPGLFGAGCEVASEGLLEKRVA